MAVVCGRPPLLTAALHACSALLFNMMGVREALRRGLTCAENCGVSCGYHLFGQPLVLKMGVASAGEGCIACGLLVDGCNMGLLLL